MHTTSTTVHIYIYMSFIVAEYLSIRLKDYIVTVLEIIEVKTTGNMACLIRVYCSLLRV